MKKNQLLSFILFMICNQEIVGQTLAFISEQYSRTASIVINGTPGKTFPLFGAFEERKWAPDWNPIPVFPHTENMSMGSIFKTASHVPGEDSVVWLVSLYDTVSNQLEYVITGSGRVIIISIQCKSMEENRTRAIITYTLTGLTEHGNHTSHHILEKLFADDLKDWQSAINDYLSKAAAL